MKKLIFPILLSTLVAAVPVQARKAVQVPTSSTKTKFQVRIDDAVLGEHTSGYDGVNFRSEVGQITGPDKRSRSHTVSAWVRRSSVATRTSGGFIGLAVADYYSLTSDASYYINFNGDIRTRAAVWNTEGGLDVCIKPEVKTGRRIAVGEWAFFTVVVDDERCRADYYVNGQLIDSQELRYEKSHGNLPSEHYGIGLFNEAQVFAFGHGSHDIALEEVQIWNRPLTPYEVRWSAALPEDASDIEGLLGLYRFDREGTSTFANLVEGGAQVEAQVVEGTIRQSGKTYYENVKATEAELTLVDGHEVGTCMLSVEQPEAGGFVSVTSLASGEAVIGELSRFTELKVNTVAEEGLRLKALTLEMGEDSEQIDPFDPRFVIVADSKLTADFGTGCNIRARSGVNGKVNFMMPDSVTVSSESALGAWLSEPGEIEFEIVPNEGFIVDSFLVNGVDMKSSISDGHVKVASDAVKDIVAEATFRSLRATVSLKKTGSGDIALRVNGEPAELVNGTAPANIGSRIDIEVAPAEGFTLWSLEVDGEDVTSQVSEEGIYTIESMEDDLAVKAEFRKSEVQLSYNFAEGGTVYLRNGDSDRIALDKNAVKLPLRSDVTLEIEPVNEESTLASLSVNGEDVTSGVEDGVYHVGVLGGDVTVEAAFDAKMYRVEATVEGEEFGEIVMVNKHYDYYYQTLSEEVVTGSEIGFEIFLDETNPNAVVVDVKEGEESIPFEARDDDGYIVWVFDLGEVRAPRQVAVTLADRTFIGGVEADEVRVVLEGRRMILGGNVAGGRIVDLAGVAVMEFSGTEADLSQLAAGFYIVSFGSAATPVKIELR